MPKYGLTFSFGEAQDLYLYRRYPLDRCRIIDHAEQKSVRLPSCHLVQVSFFSYSAGRQAEGLLTGARSTSTVNRTEPKRHLKRNKLEASAPNYRTSVMGSRSPGCNDEWGVDIRMPTAFIR
jgi:hypothetical protein